MPEWVGLYFGYLRAGVILVPIDSSSAPDFVARVKEKTNARCLFVSRVNPRQVPQSDIQTYYLEDLPHLMDGVDPDRSMPDPAEEDVAEIMFTSGTTGEPKGVILTHRNIVSNILAATQVMPVSSDSRLLSLLPLSHMMEQTAGLLVFLKFGATVVYPSSRQPSAIFRTLKEQRITNMVLVPQVLRVFWNAIERGGVESRYREAMATPAAYIGVLTYAAAETALQARTQPAWRLSSLFHMRRGLPGTKAGPLLGTAWCCNPSRLRYHRSCTHSDREFPKGAQNRFPGESTQGARNRDCSG